MHDWILVSLKIDWLQGAIRITLRNNRSEDVFLVAEGFVDLKVPKREDWSKSVSINEVEGPSELDNGNFYLVIEIQSGDKIELEAKTIYLPG